jgi:glycosyltransferase involved in cell wall biosynthesis
MICFLHGYLLEGSGSNLWTRSVIQSLVKSGQTVHLVCQEPHPERYDFISRASIYRQDGTVEQMFARDIPYAGRCIMHKPQLGDTLPVYVWDKYEEFKQAVPMVDLDDAEIEAYLKRNTDAVNRIVHENDITVMQANHVVLMSVVAQRVAEETGIPYVVMPHGSAIEYAVKPDARFHRYASDALRHASRVLVSAEELRERVLSVFPNVEGLADKIEEVRVGVDTSQFTPVARSERPGNITVVTELLTTLKRGRTRAQDRALPDRLSADISHAAVEAAIKDAANYDSKLPDEGAEEKLLNVEWVNGQTLVFIGRLIVAKGIHALIAALPEILERFPPTQLLVAGHGPLREPLEALLFALRTGNRALARWIAAGDPEEDMLVSERMDGVPEYWRALEHDGRLDRYYESAQRLLKPDTVRFVGYLTHRELSWILPCCDVGVFPSMVKESGPMVFLEALSSGCFPIGTYFAGMKGKIDSVAPYLDEGDVEWMKVRPLAEHIAGDIARVVPGALTVRDRYAATLRKVAEEEYDWQPIARKLALTLERVAQENE